MDGIGCIGPLGSLKTRMYRTKTIMQCQIYDKHCIVVSDVQYYRYRQQDMAMDSSTPDFSASNFQLPFSRNELRQDILQVFWHQLRMTTLFVDEAKVWKLVDKPMVQVSPVLGPLGFWLLELGPAEFEVSFSHVANTTFANCLEMQFDFAYRGVLTNQAATMEMDGDHTWVALYLHDLIASLVPEEIEAYTSTGLSLAIKRCHETSELANARLALEDDEIFCYFSSPKTAQRDESATFGGLTIRQIAMLSGMEEMSVRTAISRKGPTQLRTYKQDGRTLVRSEDARAWLKAKGKYLPITREWSGQQLRLEKTKFANLFQLNGALHQQMLHLSGVAGSAPKELEARLRSIYEAHGHGDVFGVMDDVQAKDAKLMTAVAQALSLPPQLLVLRAQQAQLSGELQYLDQEISQLELTPEPPALPASAAAD